MSCSRLGKSLLGNTTVRTSSEIKKLDSLDPPGDTMDVYGPYEFDLKLADEPECRPDYWADKAIKMARERDGVEFSRYEHHIFVLPSTPFLHLTVRALALNSTRTNTSP